LGALDFNEAAYSNPAVEVAAAFMHMYFTRIEPEKVMYFIPVREESENK
jgi:hypothetical protein